MNSYDLLLDLHSLRLICPAVCAGVYTQKRCAEAVPGRWVAGPTSQAFLCVTIPSNLPQLQKPCLARHNSSTTSTPGHPPAPKSQGTRVICAWALLELFLKMHHPGNHISGHHPQKLVDFTHSVWGISCFLWSIYEITFLVCGRLAVQYVLLDHLEIPVLAWNVPMLQGDEKGIGILPLKPLLCFQSCFWASCIRVQVILEEVRLQARRDELVKCFGAGRHELASNHITRR